MSHRASSTALLLVLCSCHVHSRWDEQSQPSGTPDTGPVTNAGGPGPSVGTDPFDAASADGAAADASNIGADAASGGGDPEALPTNVSFDTARKVELGSLQVWQTLHNADQVDYYAFEAEAGHFYALSTNRGAFTPDNVITLYGPDRELIAENDDGSLWPGDAIDARVVVRLPRSGTYFVVVEDRTTPNEFFSEEFASLFYQLVVRSIDASTPGFAFASGTDAAANVEFASDARSGNVYVTLLGQMSSGSRDVFSFAGKADNALIGDLLAPGPAGDGSTALLGQVRVANAAQQSVGFIDRALGQHNIHPPLSDQQYRVTVSAAGPPGTNGYYAANLTMLADNPREQFSESNDKLAMAEPLMWRGSVRRRALLLGHLPAGDVDYYGFEVAEDYQVLVACEAESGGSGVYGLRAEVRDERDKVLAFAVEDASHNLLIDKVSLTTAGMRYLRLSSNTVARPDSVEPWVRCVVNVGP
jgi:hypothetical protein